MRPKGWATAVVLCGSVAVGVAVVGEACVEPTQVTLDIRYRGGSCREVTNVVVVVGSDPTAVEARTNAPQLFPTAVTQTCQDGQVGTLVLTPSESNRAAVLVLVGLGVPAETCKASTGYLGCIVARRVISFVENKPLVIPIVLERTCANVPCNSTSSCKDGRCTTSNVQCVGDDCQAFGVLADGRPAIVVDAPTSPPNKEALCAPTDKALACGDAVCAAEQSCCYSPGGVIGSSITPRGVPTANPLDAATDPGTSSSGTSGTSSSGTSGTSSSGTSGTSSSGTSGTSSSGTSGTSSTSGTMGTSSGFTSSSGTIGTSSSGTVPVPMPTVGTSSSSGAVPSLPGAVCGSCTAGVACNGRENCTRDAPFCCFGGAAVTTSVIATTCQANPCTGGYACHENCDCPDNFVCETKEVGRGLHRCVPL